MSCLLGLKWNPFGDTKVKVILYKNANKILIEWHGFPWILVVEWKNRRFLVLRRSETKKTKIFWWNQEVGSCCVIGIPNILILSSWRQARAILEVFFTVLLGDFSSLRVGIRWKTLFIEFIHSCKNHSVFRIKFEIVWVIVGIPIQLFPLRHGNIVMSKYQTWAATPCAAQKFYVWLCGKILWRRAEVL